MFHFFANYRTTIASPRRSASSVHRRGVAVVEFALVLPLMVMLMLGMLECGRLFLVRQVMVSAAREGARVGAQSSLEGVASRVELALSDAQLTGVTVTISPAMSTAPVGTQVTVDLSVPFRDVAWLPPMFLRDRTVTASATMRKEY